MKYTDYTLAIPAADIWFPKPTSNSVVPLSKHCLRYDYSAEDGSKNLGSWIESAAKAAGR